MKAAAAPKPSGDAARGAKAAPNTVATADATSGAAQLMGTGQPGTIEAPEPIPMSTGTGAWSPQWQQTFEQLQLTPVDIEYLATSNKSEAELADIASRLGQVPVIGAPTGGGAPQPGVDAGSVASANGPLPQDVNGMQPSVAPASAWNADWAVRFADVMTRQGMSRTEIEQELGGMESVVATEEQLAQAYDQMNTSVGAFTPVWGERFTKVMTELKTPQAEQEQALLQLSTSGLDEAKLTEAYTRMQGQLPGWDVAMADKYEALGLPDALIKQAKDSKAPKAALEAQLTELTALKKSYESDGRLEKLKDADATTEEQWGVMTQGLEGKEFDKAVEQIHSRHVPMWKRALSFGVNLIPGVYALQYLTGKDWVSGEKIDRSNPLNIVGAVASGFAGFTAIRSGVQVIQGMSAASRAATATMQAAQGAKTLSSAVTTLGAASPLGHGALQAAEAAQVVGKLQSGFRVMDYVKAATPIVNRFGEAGRLSAFGRGYHQSMQLAAGAAALQQAGEGGRMVVDAATKSTVLGELKQGRSIQDALATAGRGSVKDGLFTGTKAGGFTQDAARVAADYNKYGFLQGGVGKLGEGNKLMRGSGTFRFSPFKNTAGISAIEGNPNLFSLGRNVNFGSTGGLAQGMGLIKSANAMSNPGMAAQATARAAANATPLMAPKYAKAMVGLDGFDDVQRIETMTKTAEWAKRLGVAEGRSFRTLTQVGASNRNAARMAGIVEHGGSNGYDLGRRALDGLQRYANFAVAPTVVTAVAANGMMRPQADLMWDFYKNKGEIEAREQAQSQVASEDSEYLERVYAEQQRAGGSQAPGGAANGAGIGQPAPNGQPAAGGPQVLGSSPSGGQFVMDPDMNAVLDTATGDVYDPTTQQHIGNLAQLQPSALTPTAQAVLTSAPMASAPQGAATPQVAMTANPAPTPVTAGAGATSSEPYLDQASGMFIDPASGLRADLKTGNVYDGSGAIVANLNQVPAA